ncbi:MAG: hypothetical protein AB7O97_23265 [Planctomycetota bacterium]
MISRLWILTLFALPALLPAQERSGRHFHRESRTVATAPAEPVVEASAARSERVEPVRRLRSGRAWSAFRQGRRPITAAVGAEVAAVDASSSRPVRRTAYWGRRLR